MLLVTRERGDRLSSGGGTRRRTASESSIVPAHQVLTNLLADHFRCSPTVAAIGVSGSLSRDAGFFTCHGATCFGRLAGVTPARHLDASLPEVGTDFVVDGRAELPFDLSEVLTNLRHERYAKRPHNILERVTSSRPARSVYYFLRPALEVGVRRHLQRIRLSGWERIRFPRWPVDTTVETLMRTALAAAARRNGIRKVPFIWFWPDGAQACALMTHDVEGSEGAAFCGELMDLDERHGIKAAFQLVPEVRNGDSRDLRAEIRRRGFEVNLHDLNHDGFLFDNRDEFLERATQINHYAREFGCRGFRSGAMYREQPWFSALDISYDMSVPNVAHLEPQRGGCCTVMPYFVGNVLEIPATTVQDYSLFHILGDYSTRVWEQQCRRILNENGLMTFITHPDYLIEPRARAVYRNLLAYIERLRTERNVWVAVPGQVDSWWRHRRQMTLVRDGSDWRVEGPASDRARVAFAVVDGDTVTYELGEPTASQYECAARYESRY
jgi:hypothetical protein